MLSILIKQSHMRAMWYGRGGNIVLHGSFFSRNLIEYHFFDVRKCRVWNLNFEWNVLMLWSFCDHFLCLSWNLFFGVTLANDVICLAGSEEQRICAVRVLFPVRSPDQRDRDRQLHLLRPQPDDRGATEPRSEVIHGLCRHWSRQISLAGLV